MASLRPLLCVLLLAAAVAAERAPDCEPADWSNSTCRCSSTSNPGGFGVRDTPQFVVLTFDEAVTEENYEFYKELTEQYTNPNGCPIGLTFFVSHQSTDYSLVNDLHRRGHEIATRSVSVGEIDYWTNLTREGWADEINGMRTMLFEYGKIPEEDVKGFRVPFLQMGGDLMYEVLSESNFTYDSSWPTQLYTPWYPDTNEALGTLWPYTLDFYSIQEQTVGERPEASVPGLWLNPMTDLKDYQGSPCATLDACLGEGDELETDSFAVYFLLKQNFEAHYFNDHSPYGVYTREAWFRNGENSTSGDIRHEGFQMFMNYLKNKQDVYVVTVDQLIEWVKNPVVLDDIEDFEPLQCLPDLPKNECEEPKTCPYSENLPNDLEEVVMKVCTQCPEVYPWVGNPLGLEGQ